MTSKDLRREPTGLEGPLVARTVAVDSTDPYAFLARHEGQPRTLHWANGEGVAGAGVAAEVRAAGPDRFAAIERAAAKRLSHLEHHRDPGVPESVSPRWVGGLAFAATGTIDGPFPDARFLLPQEQLTVIGGRGFLTTVGSPRERTKAGPRMAGNRRGPIVWRNEPAFETWAVGVRGALDAVRNGTVEKIVLARRLTAELPARPPLVRLLRALAGRSPLHRMVLIEPEPGTAFLAASPEILLERRRGLLRTAAIAGSRPRGRSDAEDEALARNLLSSSKDAWEHELVVRTLRQTFARRPHPFTSPVERAILKLPHVQHLETRFEGATGPDESVLRLAAQLHPTPAVGGSPPLEALRLLRQLESVDRGWYAGPVGWFDAAGDGELTVGIRSATVLDRSVTMHAGCGIVVGSDPAEEWTEGRAKFQLLLDAFEAEATT